MLPIHHNDPPAPLEFAPQAQLYFRHGPFAAVMRRNTPLWLALLVCITGLNPSSAFAQRIITTVAGNGQKGFWGNGGRAISTPLNLASFTGGVAVDAAGNLYIADTGSHRVYKVSTNGQRLTVAGSDCWVCAPEEQLAGDPQAGFSGDGGQAFNALLSSPTGVGTDTVGNLYIVDTGNQRIRKVSPDGIITTVAGNGVRGFSGDGGLATAAALSLGSVQSLGMAGYPTSVAVDAVGNLYIPDTENGRVRKVNLGGIITTVVAGLRDPYSVGIDAADNLFVTDSSNDQILKVSPGGSVTTVAQTLHSPSGLACDRAGNLYIADSHSHRIRKVQPNGVTSVIAGSGDPIFDPSEGYYFVGGFSGDGGPATSALLNFPWGVAVDAAGSVYIADSINNRIRKVTAAASDNEQGTFANPTPFLLFGPFESETSAITVSGLTGTVSKVTATITFPGPHGRPVPADLALLLVGPNGQSSILMSGVGVNNSITQPLTLTFDDAALSSLTNNLASGTYKPSPLRLVTFPPPAPSDPYGRTLSVFNGTSPNGEWKLYAVNFRSDLACGILGENCAGVSGWSLRITTTPALQNPIDDTQFFVRQQYRDFLGREAEPEGLLFYLDILNGCRPNDIECIKYTRGALSANFFRSPEFQRKGSYVMYLYTVSIGQRPVTPAELGDVTRVERPHYEEFMADSQSISTPNDDLALTENKKAALADAWMQRAEIQQKYGGLSNASFVQKLLDTAGVTIPNQNQLVQDLNSNTKNRAQVLRIIAESPEVNAKFYQQAFVTMEYFGYLRRDPEDCHDAQNWTGGDPSQCGYIFHNHRFNLDFDPSQVENVIVRGFIESPEYRGRFGP